MYEVPACRLPRLTLEVGGPGFCRTRVHVPGPASRVPIVYHQPRACSLSVNRAVVWVMFVTVSVSSLPLAGVWNSAVAIRFASAQPVAE